MSSGAVPPDAPGAPEDPETLLSPPPPPPPGRVGRRFRRLRGLSDRTPLRTKLITAVLVLVIAALAAISVASTYMLRSYLIQQHDNDLASQVNFFNTHGFFNTGGPPRQLDLGFVTQTQSSIVVGLQQSGSQLAWDPSSDRFGMHDQDPLPRLPASANWAGSVGHNYFSSTVTLTTPAQSGPNTWRVMAETVAVTISDQATQTTRHTTATLVVAVDLGNLNALTARLALFDLGVGGAIVLVLAAIGIALVRANLRPLDDIELTAGQIAAGHLDHRVPELDPRTEIGSLGRSLNTMLSQIETAFHDREESEAAAHRSEERMRRFIADASHELRTPLTTIRGFAEFYRQRGGGEAIGPSMTPQELDRLMYRMESEASRMGLLVEDLLELARLDQQRPLQMGLVDVLALAADAVQDSRLVAPTRTIELTVAPGAAFLVEGDEARLRQVIGNLVTNARTHTPPEAAITVAVASGVLETGDPAVVLDVIDDGPGMTAEQARHVFERFYRADEARNHASGGTGLGLAIVAGLVKAHGGEVAVRTAPGQGADFRVKLPLSPDAVSSDRDDDPADDERAGDDQLPAEPLAGPAGPWSIRPRPAEDILQLGD
jgi:two-component system OmpR family sensor kinase